MFRPDDLAEVNVRDYLIREQGRFFRSGSYNPYEAASQIVLEAILCGSSNSRIIVQDGWLVVCSDVDWLKGLVEAAFTQVVPFGPGGPNSLMTEVFLPIFSDSVFTATPGELTIIKGTPLESLSGNLPVNGRVVAFRADLV